MPLLEHAVGGALGGHGQAVELARESHGKVGDVDHLLHFAVPFGADFAHFQADQVAQRLLVLAQGAAQVADEQAALRGGPLAPLLEAGLGLAHDLVVLGGGGLADAGDGLAGGGVGADEFVPGRGGEPIWAGAGAGVDRL
ncbi:MAG: hypothetical protein KDE29_12220 [Anaerolineales bacterium]|nr:hypothetical protein [Anaerolineales bacterium]